MFRPQCFVQMCDSNGRGLRTSSGEHVLGHLQPDLAATFVSHPNWEYVLTLVIAGAFRNHIVPRLNTDTSKTTLTATNTVASEKLQSPDCKEHVTISMMSFCSYLNAPNPFSWIVFAGTVRHPSVCGVVRLPDDIAAMVSSHASSANNTRWTL